MKLGSYKFDRVEFSGSLGDIGTLIPLSIGLIIICGLNFTSVFLIVGLFYISVGIYYKLPIPVQPLKLVAAIAIAFPDKITIPIISATGLIFGLFLIIVAWTGFIDWMAKFFTKSIVRGVQFSLGIILITKGIGFIYDPNLFIQKTDEVANLINIPLNPLIGIIGIIVTIFLLSSKKFPAALVLIVAGIGVGFAFNILKITSFEFGPIPMNFIYPKFDDFKSALFILVIPQIPLTLGNAIIGTKDAAKTLFKDTQEVKKVTYRALATSMGLVNIITGFFAGMPLCHGAGGLAAHFRFGARTGGSNIMIGVVFLITAIFFGKIGINLLSIIPNSILGILLLFAGLELALLIIDLKEKEELFIVFIITGISLVTNNMGIAFIAGIFIEKFLNLGRIKI